MTSAKALAFVEYGDMEGPFDRRFYLQTLPLIVENYVGNSTVFYYKHYPLWELYNNSVTAAQAFECARDQKKHWELQRLIFIKQEQGQPLNLENILAWAKEVPRLDVKKLKKCVLSEMKKALVLSHRKEGTANGVSGVPTFFIADKWGKILPGCEILGAQPYETFSAALDQALSNRRCDT